MAGADAKAQVATADTAPKNSIWKAVKPFLNGGASGMLATCVIQPVDMVKVRLQLGATGSPVRADPVPAPLPSSACIATGRARSLHETTVHYALLPSSMLPVQRELCSC